MLTFAPHDLSLTDPTTGYLDFVLYTEPRHCVVTSSLNCASRRLRP
jgi:hypothetical protein